MSELYPYMYNFKLILTFRLDTTDSLFSNTLILYANGLTLGGTELM